MAYKTLQLRRDTAANWTSTNPTLAEGEIGVETDTLKFKIGDGSTAWADLDYAAIKPDDQADSVYFGSWEGKSSNTVYQAESDGFVLAYSAVGSELKILTDGSNPPTTVRQHHYHSNGAGAWHISAVCPVRKGDYWKVESASSVYWLPVELALLLAANFQIPDDGYIGSVSSPHAIQIEADGDVVLSQNLYLADGKSIGQLAGPLLTFDDTNNKLNISGCNVGIGTTAGDSRLKVHLDTDFPNEPTDPPVLEIAGNSQLALLFSSTKSCYIKGDYDGNFAMGAEGFIAYETGGFGWVYERMRITADGTVILNDGPLLLPDNGYIGSASDADAIQIKANGDVVLTQKLGIGITPSYSLHLDVPTGGEVARFEASVSGDCFTSMWAGNCEVYTFVNRNTSGGTGTLTVHPFTFRTSNTDRVKIDSSGYVSLYYIKAGSSQANAGAAAGELWKTSGHPTLPDNVVMIGV